MYFNCASISRYIEFIILFRYVFRFIPLLGIYTIRFIPLLTKKFHQEWCDESKN